MTGLATMLGKFLAPIAAAVTKAVLAEWRRPIVVEPTGFDEDLVSDMDASIEGALSNDKTNNKPNTDAD